MDINFCNLFLKLCLRQVKFVVCNNNNNNIDVQIENHALRFRENTQSKCGAFDYLDHQPGGGNVKVYSLAFLHYI